MYCRSCGAQNEDGAKFCTSCGMPLDEAVPAQSATSAGVPANAPVGASMEPDEKPIELPPDETPTGGDSGGARRYGFLLSLVEALSASRASGAIRLVATIAAAAIIVCVGASVVCAVNGSLDDGQQEAEETTQTAGDEGEDEGRNVDEAPSNEATGQGEPAADSTKDAAEAPEAPDDAEGPAGVTVRAGLNNYAWDELKAISQSMAASGSKQAAIGIASSYNLCGPSGDLTAMGSKEAVLADGSVHHVRVVGILQDQTADGGLAGLSFLFDEAVSFHSWNSSDFNDSGWESSNLRTFVLNDLAATLPQDISSQIVPVVKLTNNFGGTDSGTLPTSVVTSTVDRLWVPSYVELAGSSEENALWGPAYGTGAFTWCNPIVASEGTQYDLFSQLGITAYQPNQSLVRRFDGSSTSWWLRSANPHLVNDALCVGPDGNPSDDATPMNRFGVVPGFCI